MRNCFFALLMAIIAFSLSGIEVGGHITQDTVWSPENNPYVITSFLYVDLGVTLTILPGTEVRCVGADKINIDNFRWNSGGTIQPLSKMIIVNGVINAIGTEELPIIFDRAQDNENYKWGGVYIYPGARISCFEYCEFRNVFFCDYVPGEWSLAAVVFENGMIKIRNCTFENNRYAIGSSSLCSDVVIYKCNFISGNDTYPPPFGLTGFFGIGAASEPVPEEFYFLTIANCNFTGSGVFATIGDHTYALFINNYVHEYTARSDIDDMVRSDSGSVSSYGNTSINGSKGWGCSSATATDSVFARRNILIKPENVNPGNSPLILSSDGFGTNHVSDNYLSGCVQVKTMMSNATTSYIYNNIIENNYPGSPMKFENWNPQYQGGQIRFFNNLVRYTGSIESYAVNVYETFPFIYNNTILDYNTLHYSLGDYHTIYTNNIIDISYGFGQFSEGFYPLLYNNCLSIPIPQGSSIVGEGNIVTDPVFADTLAGDYSLGEGSPCIDAGVNRPDLPDFDLRYHKRIMPGVPGNREFVDIGAYEYNSIYIGGIEGYVYDYQSGEPVDCVRIEIQGKLPEFSDSLGAFSYPCGEGLYTVKASRWDYQDLVIPNVQVNLGEDTLLSIPLRRTNVEADDDIQTPIPASFGLGNSPNPFNPETRLSFILPQSGRARLEIYNLRGQLVRSLLNTDKPAGHYNLSWDGRDDSGRAVGSGLYLARIEHSGKSQVHKMMLAK